MKIIAGLGNPGERYKMTRHNVGFVYVDEYLRSKGFNYKDYKNKFIKNSTMVFAHLPKKLKAKLNPTEK